MAERGTAAEVLGAFFNLGLRSFGGPIAHLGYFRAEFVERRRWVDEAEFADLIALTQFLPGPGSSELGMSLGLLRAGFWGAVCAWIGFTAPSALAMILFGLGVSHFGALSGGWLHGLKIVAVAVVAQAVWGMARSLAPDRARMTLAVLAAALALALPGTAGQLGAIGLGALAGALVLRGAAAPPAHLPEPRRIGRAGPLLAIAVFPLLLGGLPLLAVASGTKAAAVASSFYRSGALVFGGGHVLLPLLQASVVPPGWVTNDVFLAGYGAAQALPGPVFTFAAYLGTAIGGVAYGVMCLVAIFLPGFLLVVGTVPFWDRVRGNAAWASLLKGINAAVVGLVLAALYRPMWTSAILGAGDFALALAAFLLLVFWRTPPWLVVLLGALAAEALSLAG
jgi:chromate transporter